MTHRDSMGMKQTYTEGQVQWLNTGRGIMHEEMWNLDDWVKTDVEIYQIWVRLTRPMCTTSTALTAVQLVAWNATWLARCCFFSFAKADPTVTSSWFQMLTVNRRFSQVDTQLITLFRALNMFLNLVLGDDYSFFNSRNKRSTFRAS